MGTREIDPVQTAWPKMKNPESGTVAAAPAPIKTSPPAKSAAAVSSSPAAASPAGPSKETSGPNIPAGPGHKLGDGSSTGRGRVRPGSAAQPPTDDPQEIRRRRMAFLDKLQKSPPADQDKKW